MLGQTCWLILLTQSWPSFNAKVGGHSYWLLFGLNVAAGVSRSIFYTSLSFSSSFCLGDANTKSRYLSTSSCQKQRVFHWSEWKRYLAMWTLLKQESVRVVLRNVKLEPSQAKRIKLPPRTWKMWRKRKIHCLSDLLFDRLWALQYLSVVLTPMLTLSPFRLPSREIEIELV